MQQVTEMPLVRAAIGAVGVAVRVSLVAWSRDRLPRLTRAIDLVGLTVLLAAVGWLIATVPLVTVLVLLLFLGWNLLVAWSGSSTHWNAQPADDRAVLVWIEEMELLSSLGWAYLDSWTLDLGQVRPTFASFQRPHDGTRIGMAGSKAAGGVVSIETLLDEGRGLMVTVRRASAQLKPAWMFRQEIAGDIEELIRRHDEAVFLLRTRTIEPAPPFPGSALAYEAWTNARYRHDLQRRWWLYAIRPIARRLSASRRRPLAEQTDLDRQIDRYRHAIETQPVLGEPEDTRGP